MALLIPQFMATPAGMAGIEVGAADLRTSYGALRPGVYGQPDLAVTIAAGIAVNVAAGVGYVQASAADERYRVENTASVLSTAFDGGGLAAPSATDPRLDQIIARVYDHQADSSTRREVVLQKVTGTPTAGATLSNRSGAAALPARSMLLADVLVPPNASALMAVNVRDRRTFVRRIVDVRQYTAGNFPAPAGAFTTVNVNTFSRRYEFTGGPVKAVVSGYYDASATTDQLLTLILDNGAQAGFTRSIGQDDPYGNAFGFVHVYVWTPAAGSHFLELQMLRAAASMTIAATAAQPLTMTVEELAPSLNNGTV